MSSDEKKLLKVALYARVSTVEQNLNNQIAALEARAKREGWEYDIYREKISTRKTRPEKDRLYKICLERGYDAVVVWKIDRWARSLTELVRDITTLYERGVAFISLQDNIDLSSASGRLQFNIISSFAQYERDIISERTKEGLKHAKNVGKRGKDKKPRRKSGYYRYHATKNKGGL